MDAELPEHVPSEIVKFTECVRCCDEEMLFVILIFFVHTFGHYGDYFSFGFV